MLNGWLKLPPELDPNYVPESPELVKIPTKNKEFGLTVSPTKQLETIKEEVKAPAKPAVGAKQPAPPAVVEEVKPEEPAKEYIEPKTRSSGGIWLLADDFPSAFNFLLLYHNPNKFKNSMIYKDLWESKDKTYKVDERDVYIKISLKDEAPQEEAKDAKGAKAAPPKGGKQAEEAPKPPDEDEGGY